MRTSSLVDILNENLEEILEGIRQWDQKDVEELKPWLEERDRLINSLKENGADNGILSVINQFQFSEAEIPVSEQYSSVKNAFSKKYEGSDKKFIAIDLKEACLVHEYTEDSHEKGQKRFQYSVYSLNKLDLNI